MNPATTSPERVIRRYLEENGGRTTASLQHLLTTFRVDSSDAGGRERIARALAASGVEVSPELERLREADDVVLSVGGFGAQETGNGSVPTGSAPPTSMGPRRRGLLGWASRHPLSALASTLVLGLSIAAAAWVAGGAAPLKSLLDEIRSDLDRSRQAQDKESGLRARIDGLTAKAQVPSLTGRTVGEAEDLISDYEWQLKAGRRPSTAEAGTIISQSPSEGTTLRSGRSLRVVVAAPLPRQWRTVQRFSGSGSTRTPEFTIPAGRARMTYSFRGGGGNDVVSLRSPEDDFSADLLVNEIGPKIGSTRLYDSEGERYLEIEGASWTVAIQVRK